MSDEEQNLVEKLDEIVDLNTLEKVSFEDVKKPCVFGKKTKPFTFVMKEKGAYVLPDTKTQVGVQDMYRLLTDPVIYCFRHALKQLETFVIKSKAKLPPTIKYLGREGEGFETIYNFELVK